MTVPEWAAEVSKPIKTPPPQPAVFPLIEEDVIVTVPEETQTPPPNEEAVLPVIEEDVIVTVGTVP
eukprot:jgi/Chrpa1/19968/Chrysochromulina_OHIO_Genome00021459-RA